MLDLMVKNLQTRVGPFRDPDAVRETRSVETDVIIVDDTGNPYD